MTIREVDSPEKPRTWLGSNGIIYHDLKGFSHLTLDLIRYLNTAHLRINDTSPKPVLMLAADVLTMDFEVQVFASHPRVLGAISAIAVVGDSFMLRHLTSMFLSYHKPAYPVMLFPSRADAEAWLLGSAQSQADSAD
ncbi:MAG: hypothetical protein CMI02_15240 [Oceanospirillaceae bacterium]|nr:hypothetical protein [Oceanospirillaceae bacterium]MBT13378.1 hypothetical protein [Oceanospirillaceae bacterium]|tara:strand:- start:21 stop:431 length:411 start_codon:yes stop_codon:yes gene_type:complete